MIDHLQGTYRRRGADSWITGRMYRVSRYLSKRAERRFLQRLESMLERLAPCDRTRLAVDEVNRSHARGGLSPAARDGLVAELSKPWGSGDV